MKRCTLLAALLAAVLAVPLFARPAEGLRAVIAKRSGISVWVPQAWKLTAWSKGPHAFTVSIPQAAETKRFNQLEECDIGHVLCRVSVAPEKLESLRDGLEPRGAYAHLSNVTAKLLINHRIEESEDGARPRMTTRWQYRHDDGFTWYEHYVSIIQGGYLYTFELVCDEAHFDAFRLDFEDMLKTAEYEPPEHGLKDVGKGYWAHQVYHFGLRLPSGWKPSLRPNSHTLFFATGKTRAALTDQLSVTLKPLGPLDLSKMQKDLPEQIKQGDEHAEMVACRKIPQGKYAAVETVYRTLRGKRKVMVVERRFRSDRYRYHVRIICEVGEFEEHKDEFQQTLNSFVEFKPGPQSDVF